MTLMICKVRPPSWASRNFHLASPLKSTKVLHVTWQHTTRPRGTADLMFLEANKFRCPEAMFYVQCLLYNMCTLVYSETHRYRHTDTHRQIYSHTDKRKGQNKVDLYQVSFSWFLRSREFLSKFSAASRAGKDENLEYITKTFALNLMKPDLGCP